MSQIPIKVVAGWQLDFAGCQLDPCHLDCFFLDVNWTLDFAGCELDSCYLDWFFLNVNCWMDSCNFLERLELLNLSRTIC